MLKKQKILKSNPPAGGLFFLISNYLQGMCFTIRIECHVFQYVVLRSNIRIGKSGWVTSFRGVTCTVQCCSVSLRTRETHNRCRMRRYQIQSTLIIQLIYSQSQRNLVRNVAGWHHTVGLYWEFLTDLSLIHTCICMLLQYYSDCLVRNYLWQRRTRIVHFCCSSTHNESYNIETRGLSKA